MTMVNSGLKWLNSAVKFQKTSMRDFYPLEVRRNEILGCRNPGVSEGIKAYVAHNTVKYSDTMLAQYLATVSNAVPTLNQCQWLPG